VRLLLRDFFPVFHRFKRVAAGFHGSGGQHGGVVAVDFNGFGGALQVVVILAVGDGTFYLDFHCLTWFLKSTQI
jgi:hypothetical protein